GEGLGSLLGFIREAHPPLLPSRFELEGTGAHVQTVCVVPLVVNSVSSDIFLTLLGLRICGWRSRGRVLGGFRVSDSWVVTVGIRAMSYEIYNSVACVVCGWLVLVVLLMMELLVEVFLVRRTIADEFDAVLLVIVGCAFGCMCFSMTERVRLWCGLHRCRPVVCGFSGLRCGVGWLVHSGGFSQNGALVVLVEVEFSLDDSLSFLVEVLSMAA
ncbi:hypothetical protein Taro_035525, partial [Colocasia esculenta]|nr:hypothetical protein [Colocasia esculenta]